MIPFLFFFRWYYRPKSGALFNLTTNIIWYFLQSGFFSVIFSYFIFFYFWKFFNFSKSKLKCFPTILKILKKKEKNIVWNTAKFGLCMRSSIVIQGLNINATWRPFLSPTFRHNAKTYS